MAYGRNLAKRLRNAALSAYVLKRGNSNKSRVTKAKRTKRNMKKSAKSKSGYKKKKEQIIKPPPSGLSHSYATNRNNKMSTVGLFDKLYQSSNYELLNTCSIVGASSTQGVGTISTILNGTDYKTIINKALTFYNLGNSTAASSQIQTNQKSFKTCLDKVISITELTNQSPGGVEIEIWDLVSKITSANYVFPDTAWGTGGQDQQIDGTTYSDLYLFSVPTQSKYFNLTWRVVKRTKVELGTGRSHEHVFNHQVNRVVDSEYFAVNAMVKGITAAQLVIGRGQVSDSTNGLTVGTISTGPVKIVGINRLKYTVRVGSSAPRQSYQVSNLPAITQGTTGQYFVQEGLGTVLNMATSTIFG
nr:MAG: capsid protein [Cressdnaviricota sp.]